MSYSLAQRNKSSLAKSGEFVRSQGAILFLLTAHLPMVAIFAKQSMTSPLFRLQPIAVLALLWLTSLNGSIQRPVWRVSSVLMVMLDVFCVFLGVWRASAWLVTFGCSLSVLAWILACQRESSGRFLFAIVVMMALIVRLPPSLDAWLWEGFQNSVTSLSSAILNTCGLIHFSDANGLHVTGTLLDAGMLRGGIASAWVMLVAATVFSAWERRSAPHLVLLLIYTAFLGLILSTLSTTLGASLAVSSSLDLSRGIAGFCWRFLLLVAGLAAIWSADKVVLLFTGGIPVMEDLVTGRKAIRRYEDDEEEEEQQRPRRENLLTSLFNAWVAPLAVTVIEPPPSQSVAMSDAAIIDGSQVPPATAVPRKASASQSGTHTSAEVPDALMTNSPAAVRGLIFITALTILAVQLIRVFGIGS
jgi:hypothetical protein